MSILMCNLHENRTVYNKENDMSPKIV